VQDLGRPGYADAGVSASGAADPIALRVGNRLVGNAPAAAALEMTLTGGTFRFDADAVVALTGADAGAQASHRRLAPWRAHVIAAGDTLACGPMVNGARAYLCVRGGIDVPPVLGSRSTHLVTKLGGLSGRALVAGDRLSFQLQPTADPFPRSVDPDAVAGYRRGEAFRVVDGPQADWFAGDVRARFLDAEWQVSEAADRMGLRLTGPPVAQQETRELVSEGVCLGAIQVPAGGAPIVLFVEHQTTGGYPKIANVIAADVARLGRLRPRDPLRFERTTVKEAHMMSRAQEEALSALFE
jgi:antagonist of KipI